MLKNIEDIVEYGKDFKTISTRLESLLIEANDISFDLESLSNNVVFDAEKLKKYEEKITFLNHIKSKYGPTIKDVINHKESLKNQIIISKNYNKEISTYESKIKVLKQDLINLCKKISDVRKKMKPLIEKAIKQKIVSLDLENAEIQFKTYSDHSFLSNSVKDKSSSSFKTFPVIFFTSVKYAFLSLDFLKSELALFSINKVSSRKESITLETSELFKISKRCPNITCLWSFITSSNLISIVKSPS